MYDGDHARSQETADFLVAQVDLSFMDKPQNRDETTLLYRNLLERFVNRTPMTQQEMDWLVVLLRTKHVPGVDGKRWRLNSLQQDVMCFMHAMDQIVGDRPGLRDTILRKHLIAEEAKELCDAIDAGDFVEAVDGCIDLMYVVVGSLCAWGVEMQLPWNEVHKSNMEKSGHKKDDRGKVLKPDGWVPPRIDMILKAYGWEGEEG